jgi:hypothetical protein
MNYYNISRATQGLVAYLRSGWCKAPSLADRSSSSLTTRAIFLWSSRNSSRALRCKWLRRLPLQRAALHAATILRRARAERQCRHRHHREPQPAP